MAIGDVINNMLPPEDNMHAHITGSTGQWGASRSEGKQHNGVDINYPGGQNATINQSHPPVYSPVTGIVIDVIISWGQVQIRDAKGFVHSVTHLHEIQAYKNQTVRAGQTQIGRMGGRGPGRQYDQHVDYKIRTQQNTWINPDDYWR